jgi:pyruvate/2-oxoglutarate dehydrogenase complex dihydrolipoamide acyltransferase (E2) component
MARKTTTANKTTTTASKTTTARKATAKTAAKTTSRAPRKKAAAAPAQAPAQAPAVVTETPSATVLPAPDVVRTLTKRDLIERVVETSGIKKKEVKPVVEAMLREMGEALSRGETLNLQPMGKGIVKARKAHENAEVVELRLRRSKQAMADASGPMGAKSDTEGGDGPRDPLAEAAE